MPEYSITATTDTDVEALTDDQVDTLMGAIAGAHGVVGGQQGRLAFTLTVDAEDMAGAVHEGLAVVERATTAARARGAVVAVEVLTTDEFDRRHGPWDDEPPFAPDLVVEQPARLWMPSSGERD